jgi:hypothetical protein
MNLRVLLKYLEVSSSMSFPTVYEVNPIPRDPGISPGNYFLIPAFPENGISRKMGKPNGKKYLKKQTVQCRCLEKAYGLTYYTNGFPNKLKPPPGPDVL